MRQKILEQIAVPEGVSCSYEDGFLIGKKGSVELKKEVQIPGITIKVAGKNIELSTEKGNKNELKVIKAYAAHIRNLFAGLGNKFVYKLESCNVHFPMTMKIDKSKLIINNFLGEKTPRIADIVKGSEVEIKGQFITVTSHDKESAGQTAANIEKATRISNRDRRIFQDGIYITEKPGRTE